MSTRQKKLLFSLMFLFFFLFFARGGWLPADVRINTGDLPGTNYSKFPQVRIHESNVYAVWHDRRNGDFDIYFNYSNDRGVTWQAIDIRLDTGDTAGANHSTYPQISSSGDNVYVVWEDRRNATYSPDIYFNYSTNGGASWQATDIRLDIGDPPGASNSWSPQICSNGNYVYVVWHDLRNSSSDIYFNYSTNGGATWLPSDIRLDIGDSAGENGSFDPQISISGDNVYVVWEDARNEVVDFGQDIYFNYSTDGGASWQVADIRLDTGDSSGAHESRYPQISSSGDNVYVVWHDWRNSLYTGDIYFNYSTDGGASWQASDTRVDLGDTPGSNYSNDPQICCTGNNVYTAWYDGRNGSADIYFNYSADGGVTWEASAIRLDTGDTPGSNRSSDPRISCSGSKVYVVWMDQRNGEKDIYFNYSIDGGGMWQTPDLRLDTGDSPGASTSACPEISSLENNACLVWHDNRNGATDIYFNNVSLPLPDIKANGSDGPVTITQGDALLITIDFNAGIQFGEDADWWILMKTSDPKPNNWYYFDMPTRTWMLGRSPTRQGSLFDVSSKKVPKTSGLAPGTYTFYFAVDMVMNGSIDVSQAFYDKVKVTINP